MNLASVTPCCVVGTVFLFAISNDLCAQGPPDHCHSVSGCYSHSVSRVRHSDGTWSVSQSYRNGRQRWSQTYYSWENDLRRDRPWLETPQAIVEPPKPVRVVNPFFKPKAPDLGMRGIFQHFDAVTEALK